MAMVTLNTTVKLDVYKSIEEGTLQRKWKSSYDFLKTAVLEKLQREGLIKV